MTSKTKTVRPAPECVQNFIRSATPAQRLGFIAKGEPQCIALQTRRNDQFLTVYLPGLRGVIVGKEQPTPDEAIKVAAERLAEFLTEEREDVDEAALGLSQQTIDLVDAFEEVGCRIDEIFHLGTMAAGGQVPDELMEVLGDLSHGNNSAILADLPFLKSSLRKKLSHDDREASLVEMIHDQGIYGFIVCVSLPLHEPTGEGCARIRMGIRHREYRYGHTYEIACQRALEWARAEYDRMMSEPVKSAA